MKGNKWKFAISQPLIPKMNIMRLFFLIFCWLQNSKTFWGTSHRQHYNSCESYIMVLNFYLSLLEILTLLSYIFLSLSLTLCLIIIFLSQWFHTHPMCIIFMIFFAFLKLNKPFLSRNLITGTTKYSDGSRSSNQFNHSENCGTGSTQSRKLYYSQCQSWEQLLAN